MLRVEGDQVAGSFCVKCGGRLQGATRFCTSCGASAEVAPPQHPGNGARTSAPAGPAPDGPRSSTSATLRIALVLAGLVTAAIAIGAGAWLVLAPEDDTPRSAAAGPDTTPIETSASPDARAESSPPSASPSASPEKAEATSPEAALLLTPDQATGQLLEMRQRDLPARDALDGAWIPQLSSKCEGLTVDIGPGWFPDGFAEVSSVTTEQILAYHLALEQRHGALTVTRADVSTSAEGVCQDRDMWVSLAPVRFASADEALGWCADEGYNADECAARYLVARGESGTELTLRD